MLLNTCSRISWPGCNSWLMCGRPLRFRPLAQHSPRYLACHLHLLPPKSARRAAAAKRQPRQFRRRLVPRTRRQKLRNLSVTECFSSRLSPGRVNNLWSPALPEMLLLVSAEEITAHESSSSLSLSLSIHGPPERNEVRSERAMNRWQTRLEISLCWTMFKMCIQDSSIKYIIIERVSTGKVSVLDIHHG